MNGSASAGLQRALNEIRETVVQDNALYQTQIPVVDDYTSSQAFGNSLLKLPTDMRNRFIGSLVNRIAFTQFEVRYFRNPLRGLMGDQLPLGAIGQNIYVNPARGRVYNIDDFAGLLARYESDVKSEYTEINFDVQYPVTIIRKELEKAFVSWGAFEDFLANLSASLYNGAYIDDYKYTKKLITNAYRNNAVRMQTISFSDIASPSEAELKTLTKKLRQAYLDFQAPTDKFNAWAKVGGYGRAIVTWSDPEDIIVFINNKLASELDVDVLANAFNIDRATLKGNVYYVEDFNIINDMGEVEYDGSKIVALICDRRWFKIREKDMFMDEFYNANNRSWQNYLNVIKSFNYSLFANALMFVTEAPTINTTALTVNDDEVSINTTGNFYFGFTTTPANSNDTLSVTITNTDNVATTGLTATIVNGENGKYVKVAVADTYLNSDAFVITISKSGTTLDTMALTTTGGTDPS